MGRFTFHVDAFRLPVAVVVNRPVVFLEQRQLNHGEHGAATLGVSHHSNTIWFCSPRKAFVCRGSIAL